VLATMAETQKFQNIIRYHPHGLFYEYSPREIKTINDYFLLSRPTNAQHYWSG